MDARLHNSDQNTRLHAVVTGGSRGIGKAVCLILAKQGYDISFTYNSNHALAEGLVAELKALGSNAKAYSIDFSDKNCSEQIEKLTEASSRIDLLVNNAAISIDGLMMRFKSNDLDALLNTNLRSSYIMAQSILRPMMKAKQGSIIFMSSVIGQNGNAGQTAYATTKAGLIGLTKSLAKEVASRNIRVNAIAPGFIQTDMTSSLPEANKQSILAQIPLGRFGTVDDIAQMVSFLASPDSSYITGQVFAVNGGLYM